jgi:hypothetical protein
VFKGNYFGNWRALAWCVDKVIGGDSVSTSVRYDDMKLMEIPECVDRGSPSATGEIMCRPFIVQVLYQHQRLVHSWNLEDKIEFWMLVWNARCEAGAITRKSLVQHTPKHQAFFLLLDVRHHLSLQYWHRNSMGVLSICLLPNKATSNIRQAH